MNNKRPKSLVEVAAWSDTDEAYGYNLADFLDQFRHLLDVEMLHEEPPSLVGRIELGSVADAYLAAVAVSLAREVGNVPPPWSLRESRKLRRPWFAHPGPRIRATLLAESPGPFRERNLFVSRNALSRA
jgi:hypothetical protein